MLQPRRSPRGPAATWPGVMGAAPGGISAVEGVPEGVGMVIKIVIADDHDFLRSALEALFDETDDIRVVATCADGNEVVPAVLRTSPDVVLMDLQMPQTSGLEAMRELIEAELDVRVVVLTATFTPANEQEARNLGAAGFLLKGDDPHDLPDRIRAVAAGGTAWSNTADAANRA